MSNSLFRTKSIDSLLAEAHGPGDEQRSGGRRQQHRGQQPALGRTITSKASAVFFQSRDVIGQLVMKKINGILARGGNHAQVGQIRDKSLWLSHEIQRLCC